MHSENILTIYKIKPKQVQTGEDVFSFLTGVISGTKAAITIDRRSRFTPSVRHVY